MIHSLVNVFLCKFNFQFVKIEQSVSLDFGREKNYRLSFVDNIAVLIWGKFLSVRNMFIAVSNFLHDHTYPCDVGQLY